MGRRRPPLVLFPPLRGPGATRCGPRTHLPLRGRGTRGSTPPGAVMSPDDDMPDWMQKESDPNDVGGGADWFQWSDLGPGEVHESTVISQPVPGPKAPAVEHGDAEAHGDAESDYSRLEFRAIPAGTDEAKTYPVSSKGLASQVKDLWSYFTDLPLDIRVRVEEYDEEEDRPSSYQLEVVDDGSYVPATPPGGDD